MIKLIDILVERQIGEIFGFSKKEKEQNYIKQKLKQAEKEIDNYNFDRIFKQPADNKNNQELQSLVDIVLKDAGYSLQTVKLLMPQLFKRDDNGGAMAATYDYNGKYLNGIVPSNFWFLVGGGQQVLKGEKAKERMKQELEMFISDKLTETLSEAKKVESKLGAFEEFATTRKKGAEKITDNAKEKGGLALLTWHHFKVKLPYYKKAQEGKLDLDKAKKEFEETYNKISLNMSQIEFQREVGRLEVLGELLIRNR